MRNSLGSVESKESKTINITSIDKMLNSMPEGKALKNERNPLFAIDFG
tara:strand:- start:211 stop:354 length:144 start_codon:yes stop_codon:yes gene_type:complete